MNTNLNQTKTTDRRLLESFAIILPLLGETHEKQ